MYQSILSLARGLAIFVLVASACADSGDLPIGPCNDDGATSGAEYEDDESVSLSLETAISPVPTTGEPPHEMRPTLPKPKGWLVAPTLDMLYRHATTDERRRLGWPKHTLVLATPGRLLDRAGENEGPIRVELPLWQENQTTWVRDSKDLVHFERRELTRVQTLVLGHFLEHHHTDDSAVPEVHHPLFQLYGHESLSGKSRIQLLADARGGFLLRWQSPGGHCTQPIDSVRLRKRRVRGS